MTAPVVATILIATCHITLGSQHYTKRGVFPQRHVVARARHFHEQFYSVTHMYANHFEWTSYHTRQTLPSSLDNIKGAMLG
jgi:hypothetical protein